MNKKGRVNTRSLASSFPIRLFDDQVQRYKEEAEASGVTLSQYLRDRLDGEDNVLEVLSSVLERLSDIDNKLDDLNINTQGGNDAISVEMLLLLRSLLRNNSGKDTIKMVQADIKNMGLQPFDIDHGERR